jgi:hypothetical protein
MPRKVYSDAMGIRDVAQHGHPLVRGGVVAAAAVLLILLIMTAVSVVVGLLWVVIKILLFVLLIAGVAHILGRHRTANRR